MSGDWSTAADWTGGHVPDTRDDGSITASGTYGVAIASAASAASLLIEGYGVTVTDSASLAIRHALTVSGSTFVLAKDLV